MAGELGFEPRLTESESVVLPLDDSPNDLSRPVADQAVNCARIIHQKTVTSGSIWPATACLQVLLDFGHIHVIIDRVVNLC